MACASPGPVQQKYTGGEGGGDGTGGGEGGAGGAGGGDGGGEGFAQRVMWPLRWRPLPVYPR